MAGKNSAQSKPKPKFPNTIPWIQESGKIDSAVIAQNWLTIKNTMWNYVGLVRTRERLHKAELILRNLKHDIEEFYQKSQLTPDILSLRNGIQTAVAITSAALEDRVSRGCHYIE